MYYNRTALIFGFGLLFVQSFSNAEGLCSYKEDVVFNCTLGKSTASLCVAHNSDRFFYRKGSAKTIELELQGGPGTNFQFLFSRTPYSGGGEAHVHFSNKKYSYFLYDKTANGDEGPESKAGVLVFYNKKRVANLICTNDASIRSVAYQTMPKEAYEDIGVK